MPNCTYCSPLWPQYHFIAKIYWVGLDFQEAENVSVLWWLSKKNAQSFSGLAEISAELELAEQFPPLQQVCIAVCRPKYLRLLCQGKNLHSICLIYDRKLAASLGQDESLSFERWSMRRSTRYFLSFNALYRDECLCLTANFCCILQRLLLVHPVLTFFFS